MDVFIVEVCRGAKCNDADATRLTKNNGVANTRGCKNIYEIFYSEKENDGLDVQKPTSGRV